MLTYTVGRQQAASQDFELWLPKQLVAGSHRYSGLHFGRFLGHALVHFVFFVLVDSHFSVPVSFPVMLSALKYYNRLWE